MKEANLPSLLIVDDEPVNLQILRGILQQDYRLFFARDGAKAIELAFKELPNLILLDVMMPELSGFETCQALKANPQTANIPIIFVTALSDTSDETYGFELGAVDYITKPVSPAIVKARTKNHLNLVRAAELERTRLQIILKLGKAAEYKDNETGMHVIRMSHVAKELALAIGCDAAYADTLLNAAPMHDIGKIGIPDSILQKPGPLDANEWEIMKTHAEIGAQIIGDEDSSLLMMAATIARCHHEKWDGSGYPQGLTGEDIPLAARIVAIADVFDALTSVRPYKKAWSLDEALQQIQRDAGRHFDPNLVQCFLSLREKLIQIKAKWAD